MFKVEGCLNVRHRRLTAGGSSDWNIFHCHAWKREREREKLLSCCVTYSHFLLWIPFQVDDGDGFTPTPTLLQHRLDTINAAWVSQMEAEGGSDRQKSWTHTVETDPSYSTWWNYRERFLLPRACFLMWPQSDLLRWLYRMFHLATSVPEARGQSCLSGNYGSAKRNNMSKTTSRILFIQHLSVTAQSSQSCIIKLLLIHISVLTVDQRHSVGSHSTVWLHIFNLCFKDLGGKNQLI